MVFDYSFYWNLLVGAQKTFANDLAKWDFGRTLRHGLNMNKWQELKVFHRKNMTF
jgi:hypothetical protein